MSFQRALTILIGVSVIASGIVYIIGIPSVFGIKTTPDTIGGIILIVGGGLITFFGNVSKAAEFFQKLFSYGVRETNRPEIPYSINNPSNLQNRLNLISIVRNAWIRGVFESNLQDAIRLELGLKEIPNLLLRPNLQIRYQEFKERLIITGTPIRQIFQESGQALLILGEPGSGKTFTMLELARDLLDEAERDEYKPIPIVLNLSSWARERISLRDWIIEEINLEYQLATKVTQTWIENDQLCLLLDGLDEVSKEWRNACVDAINTFKLLYNASMVVCSRTKDYKTLNDKLDSARIFL